MTIYFDASFLVSLYSLDANSASAFTTIQTGPGEFWTTTFGEFEFVNALALRVFRGHDTHQQSRASLSLFERDLRTGVFQVMPLTDDIFSRATKLSRETTPQMGTRASDVLHVAAALALGADGFYTFDRQQGKLADAVKLKTNVLFRDQGNT